MLTSLQRRVWAALTRIPEADAFALAGGGAMIALGIVERETDDLDLFGTAPEHVQQLGAVVDTAMSEQGFTTEHLRSTPSLLRLEVLRDDDAVTVDLGYIHPRFATVQTADGQVISPQDLAADKLLAMWARSAPRDFVDVHALAQRFSLEEMCRLAALKDLGFRRDLLVLGLEPFGRLPRNRFDIDDAHYADLSTWVSTTLDSVASRRGPSTTRSRSLER